MQGGQGHAEGSGACRGVRGMQRGQGHAGGSGACRGVGGMQRGQGHAGGVRGMQGGSGACRGVRGSWQAEAASYQCKQEWSEAFVSGRQASNSKHTGTVMRHRHAGCLSVPGSSAQCH